MLFLRPVFWAPTLVIYFLVQTAIRTAIGAPLTADEAEIFFAAQKFSMRYDGMQPLYPWLQYMMFQVLGETVLALALLKNVILLTTCALVNWLVYRVSGLHMAWAATLSLVFLPHIIWNSQHEMTAAVLATCLALGLVVAMMSLYRSPRLWNFLAFGVLAGLGFLAALDFVWVLSALVFSAITSNRFRPILQNPLILVAGFVGAYVALIPRYLVSDSLGFLVPDSAAPLPLNTQSLLARIADGFSLIEVGFVFVAVLLIGVCAAVYRGFGDVQEISDDARALRELLGRSIAVGFLVMLGAVIISGVTISEIETVQPLLVFAAPLATLHLFPVATADTQRSFVRLSGAIAVAALVFSPAYYSFGARTVAMLDGQIEAVPVMEDAL